ncbi:MAG: hypothetical protein DWQ19_09485 [Crenarchaeota archaeon]|nr:MAG: hypothetical protein DWQ19_09485 [Thermoproteota archaeon]
MKQLFAAIFMLVLATPVVAQQRFSELVGPVNVTNSTVKADGLVPVPYITWGGDVAEFYANGGLKTTNGSINNKLGLNIALTKGDDFVQQVRDYMTGKSPFLRMTLDMAGQASEVLNSDPRTKPHILVQLTWSAGDHVVATEGVKTLNDLVSKPGGKKVRVAVQQGGPHVGLLYKMLKAAQATKDDIEIVWTQDLSGPKGPAEVFRKGEADAACVITPDMIGLTGGVEGIGSGAEGTVKGAHVVVSTQTMTRAIADVWAVRSDWYNANKSFCEKFVAGFLKGSEDLVAMRKQFDETNKLTPEYRNILTVAQNAFGKEVIPSLEIDGHGLLLDATFVGLPGQVSWFEDKGNLNGYEPSAKSAVDLAVDWGYAKSRNGFVPAELNYQNVATIAGVEYKAPKNTNRIAAEQINVFPDSDLDDRTILSFSINFKPNQDEFSVDQYGSEFNRALEIVSTFGNSLLVVRGHADPTKTLTDLIKAGIAKGVIQRRGASGSYHYYLNGQELDLENTDKIVSLIKAGAFDGAQPTATLRFDPPQETMMAALKLSTDRAEEVVEQISKFAHDQGKNFDASQVKPVGAGIAEPVVAKPSNMDEAEKNMRVEFRIIRISPEAIKPSDFDY